MIFARLDVGSSRISFVVSTTSRVAALRTSSKGGSNPAASSWFRGAEQRHDAHIRAGGVDKDVLLVERDDLNDEIDAAYHTKYRRYAASIIEHITSPEARAATLELVPRSC